MKFLSLFFILSLSIAFAENECVDKKGKDISDDPEAIEAAIEATKGCYFAHKLAHACAYGSLRDIGTIVAASNVCDKAFKANQPADALDGILKIMNFACNNTYEKIEGTMAASRNGYCQLDALKWVHDLAEAAAEAREYEEEE